MVYEYLGFNYGCISVERSCWESVEVQVDIEGWAQD